MSDSNDQPPQSAHPAGESANAPPDEAQLLVALRQGDEAAFMALVTMHYAAMLRLAQVYVGSRAVAEEVIQETWLGVLRGLDRLDRKSTRLNSSHRT